MLKMAFVFLFISLLAGVFGFTRVSAGTAAASGVAKILSFVAMAFFLLLLILAMIFGHTTL